MATTTCSPAYGSAFREPAPTAPAFNAAPLSATLHALGLTLGAQQAAPAWTWALPEPEPEQPQQLVQQQLEEQQLEEQGRMIEMALDSLVDDAFSMELLPDLDMGDDGCDDMVEPWSSPAIQEKETTTAQQEEMLNSPVFRCDSPSELAELEKVATGVRRAAKKSVSFGASNRIRTIPAVVSGVPIPFAFGVGPADLDEWLKENDGPSRSSAMLDMLLRAYFEHGATTVEYLQRVLGQQNCEEIARSAAELAGMCFQLAEKLEDVGVDVAVGVLPSNTRMNAAHAPGVRTLAKWMWSC